MLQYDEVCCTVKNCIILMQFFFCIISGALEVCLGSLTYGLHGVKYVVM